MAHLRTGRRPCLTTIEFERRDDVKPLIAGADAGDEIARRVAAKTGIAPILSRPFRGQHVFEIELPSAGRGLDCSTSLTKRRGSPASHASIARAIPA